MKNVSFEGVFDVSPKLKENEQVFFDQFNEARNVDKKNGESNVWKSTKDGNITWKGVANLDLGAEDGKKMMALMLQEICLLKAVDEEKNAENYKERILNGALFAKGKDGDLLKITVKDSVFSMSKGKVKVDVASWKDFYVSDKTVKWEEPVEIVYSDYLPPAPPKM